MTGPQLATRVMRARTASICPACGQPIHVGQQIAKAGTWQHIEHVIDSIRKTSAEGTRP